MGLLKTFVFTNFKQIELPILYTSTDPNYILIYTYNIFYGLFYSFGELDARTDKRKIITLGLYNKLYFKQVMHNQITYFYKRTKCYNILCIVEPGVEYRQLKVQTQLYSVLFNAQLPILKKINV